MEASDHLPSLHEITQKQATESWNKIRPELLKVAIASEALPKNRQCSCCIEEASCRCLQCGPNIFTAKPVLRKLIDEQIFFILEKYGRY